MIKSFFCIFIFCFIYWIYSDFKSFYKNIEMAKIKIMLCQYDPDEEGC